VCLDGSFFYFVPGPPLKLPPSELKSSRPPFRAVFCRLFLSCPLSPLLFPIAGLGFPLNSCHLPELDSFVSGLVTHPLALLFPLLLNSDLNTPTAKSNLAVLRDPADGKIDLFDPATEAPSFFSPPRPSHETVCQFPSHRRVSENEIGGGWGFCFLYLSYTLFSVVADPPPFGKPTSP